MKIKIAHTLAFTPLQLQTNQQTPRRAVGLLQGVENGRDYLLPVYNYRYDSDDRVRYQLDESEKVFIECDHTLPVLAANQSDQSSKVSLSWVEHQQGQSYKPYAFLVMNGITRLAQAWDGVVYRTPSGDMLCEAGWERSLQIIDACVCGQSALWAMVQFQDETLGSSINQTGTTAASAELTGWVRL